MPIIIINVLKIEKFRTRVGSLFIFGPFLPLKLHLRNHLLRRLPFCFPFLQVG